MYVIRISVAALLTLVAGNPTADNIDNPTANLQVDPQNSIKEAQDFLERINDISAEWSNKQAIAGWNYASNLTQENLAEKLNVSTAAAHIIRNIAREVNNYNWRVLPDEYIRRQFQKLGVLGAAALSDDVRISVEIHTSLLIYISFP